jgi:hypothetical protein
MITVMKLPAYPVFKMRVSPIRFTAIDTCALEYGILKICFMMSAGATTSISSPYSARPDTASASHFLDKFWLTSPLSHRDPE